jgi:hypothetical protein
MADPTPPPEVPPWADIRNFLAEAKAVMEAARAPFQSFIDELAAWSDAVEPALAAFADGLKETHDLFEDWKKHAPTRLKAISDAGLIVPTSQMSVKDVVDLAKVGRTQDDAAVIRHISDFYDELFRDPTFLEQLEATWADHPVLVRRLPLLQASLEAHRHGLYAVSVPTLLAQFEGLIADGMKHAGRMRGTDFRNHVESLAAGESITGHMFASFVGDAFLAKFVHGSPVPPFSRHAILHGGDIDYATERNSRTAILLIDCLRGRLRRDDRDPDRSSPP